MMLIFAILPSMFALTFAILESMFALIFAIDYDIIHLINPLKLLTVAAYLRNSRARCRSSMSSRRFVPWLMLSHISGLRLILVAK